MSRRDDEHHVLMKLGDDVDLVRQVAEKNRIDSYTRENPGREVRVAVEEASSDLQERLERFQDTAEGAENALVSIAGSQAEAAESLEEISDHTSYLPAINENAYVTADGVNYLGELGEEMVEEQAETNATLSIMAGHTEELPEIRAELGTLNKIAGTHLGIAAVGVVAQVRGLKKLGDIHDELCELHDDINEGFEDVVDGLDEVVEGLENVECAIIESGEKISKQIAVSAAASAQKIAEHLDFQTAVVSERLEYLARVSDANRQAVVAAIERFSAEEERRKQEVVTAIRSSQENDAESKFRDALMQLSLGHYGVAINTLSEVFQHQGTHAPAWMFFGDCCWRLGQSDEARNAYYLASRYALLAKKAGRDTLAMKNKEIFEKSLVRLSRLEALLGNDKYAMKVLIDGKEAWGRPWPISRINYEITRLEIKEDPKLGKARAYKLVRLARVMPDIREEISTSPFFKHARRTRKSLKYGNGPFVELAEILDFFDGMPILHSHLVAANPSFIYRLYVYGRLYKKLRTDLGSMTGDCRKHSSSGCGIRKWRNLGRIQKAFIELKEEFMETRRDYYGQHEDVEYEELEQPANNHALWSMLTKLHLKVWNGRFAVGYLGWKKFPRNKLFKGDNRQPYSFDVRSRLRVVCSTLNDLGFFKHNDKGIRSEIELCDLVVVDGEIEYTRHTLGFGPRFEICGYYGTDVPMEFTEARPIAPWWNPKLDVHQPVVMFKAGLPLQGASGPFYSVYCVPLDLENITAKIQGSFDQDRVIKIKFKLGKLKYIKDEISKERDVWVGNYRRQKVYYLSDKSPYDNPDDIGKSIKVRVKFFSFKELQVVEVVRGLKRLPRDKGK